jgi:putative transcriptional regulator
MLDLPHGTFLIAEPFLKGEDFMRSIVLLCRHTEEEGSLGFTLNKTSTVTLAQLFDELKDYPLPVNIGGPVQKDTLHYIHQYPDLFPDSELILEDVYWGGDFETLKIHLKNDDIDPDKIKFFLGYSGWSSGQLQQEIEEGTWLTAMGTRPIIFETPDTEKWKTSLQLLGKEYGQLAHYPIDPQLN